MPHVICWRSLVEDTAARLFSVTFFSSIGKHGKTVREAFEDARQAVLMQTRPGYTADGKELGHFVSRFELRDPMSGPPHSPAGFTSRGYALPMAAGVPLLLSVEGDVDGDCTHSRFAVALGSSLADASTPSQGESGPAPSSPSAAPGSS